MNEMTAPPSDQDLLQATAQGDRWAFAALMERHTPFALALAMRMLGNADDAEEVAQEAFLRVWRKAPDWDGDGGARFTTWLYRVVINLCTDRKRRKPIVAMDDIDEPPDPGPDGLERLAQGQMQKLVSQALNHLPERQRAAIALCHLGETTNAQAAETLGISVSALESLLVRGRRGLRDYLSRQGFAASGDLL
ncbi:ECF RNA polymerase sigma factor SigW [Magnetospirillum gryphiswaldense MSR-1]|uniref:RNA polymerase sigma factor n=3 Tax=Magnetospirillum gryphiswaldense TaxID=55518 RepID=V6EW72_MAGGM|nr:ECF RNA polymerase sigma factor SigW [Magnetospirillum gryphiswaldense MSR-1]AVM76548.1 ECF RNA polymerase sigma factor SigW [Magnetospirillum gryphiswaldense]CAM77818.1 RNA polymerase sigma factor [Magnetospirillum gryphiswaldense MSR-1]CDK97322.1 putative RNA polymerase sigma factor [Magnetospirillum gryphiswaldense MSR-1 v2]